MSSYELIKEFEDKLEVQIKNAFRKELYDDKDEFYIAADYDTKCRINDLVQKLDLRVFGMSITESEFSVTFEFVGVYSAIINMPRHCRTSWNNEGEYDFFLTKDNLNENWWLSITDIQFNHKDVSEDIIAKTIKSMSEVLLMTGLKN
jgi:hypothetical protein